LCDASVEQIMMQFVEKHMREPGQVASQSRPGTMLAIEDRLAASSAPLVATDTRAAEARNSPHCAAASAEDLENVSETEARDGGCTEDADDIVRQMEAVAIGGGTTKKRPAAALKRPAAALKRPAAAPTKISVSKPTKTKVGKFAMKVSKPTKSIIKKGGKCIRLGCSRCRGSSRGCASCRNPAFQGTRFQGASRH
jgi:esterase/lipase superfamily enzyme